MFQKAVAQTADTINAALAAVRDPLGTNELITLAQRRMNLVDFGSTPFRGAAGEFAACVP